MIQVIVHIISKEDEQNRVWRVAIALFALFVDAVRKLDNKKTHLCLAVRDVLMIIGWAG